MSAITYEFNDVRAESAGWQGNTALIVVTCDEWIRSPLHTRVEYILDRGDEWIRMTSADNGRRVDAGSIAEAVVLGRLMEARAAQEVPHVR